MKRFWTYVFVALILAGLAAIGLFAGRFVVYLSMRVLILSIFALAWIPTDYGFPNNETNKSVLQGAFQPR